MSEQLEVPLTSWIGSALRHVNAHRQTDVLDFSRVGIFPDNRWNTIGEPTLYLAGDIGVAIAEWGRRFPLVFAGDEMQPVKRDVHRLHLRLDAVFDLRSPEAAALLKLPADPSVFRDIAVARSIARTVGSRTRAQAMLVPSIAFLDDMTRWNLVIFLEKMPTDRATWITRVERVGPLSWSPD